MSIRRRFLLAAGAIVVVSLLVSGFLTWVLVRQLDFQGAHEQLDQVALAQAPEIRRQDCLLVPPVGQAACPQGRIASGAEYEDRLLALTPTLGVDRLLVVDRNGGVVYDSSGGALGRPVAVKGVRTLSGQAVNEGDFALGGDSYIGAGVALDPRRNPLGGRFAVLARSKTAISAVAFGQLLPLLVAAGLLSLLVSVLLALVVTRALARPLSELSTAAEDIAAGNYRRRVSISGTDEIGVVGSAFNRMAEALEKARGVQRDFLANVSHELKTPLTSLIGFSQALVDGSLRSDSERKRAATIVHEESQRVLRLAQELLDLARVESGQVVLQMQPVDLAAQMQQELEMVRKRADVRQLRLELATSDGLPPVKADPERLHQILDNLLDNAVKYAPAGATVAVRISAGPDGVLTSVGNPLGEHQPDPHRMFDRFYRADPARSSAAGGVGLGLAISRELANAHGGKLFAELDDAGKLVIHLLLPAAPSESKGETSVAPRPKVVLPVRNPVGEPPG